MIEKINIDDSKIIPGSGPYYIEANKIDVLKIHGVAAYVLILNL
jgi:hypothetical protein